MSKLKKTMFKKNILFLTSTRADFSKLKSLILRLQKSKNFQVNIFVTGMQAFLCKYIPAWIQTLSNSFST